MKRQDYSLVARYVALTDGQLVWKAKGPQDFAYPGGASAFNRKFAGKPVGLVKGKNGYQYFRIRGVAFLAHRAIWLLSHGSLPRGVIDHINGDPCDNSIENLRDVPHHVNIQNSAQYKTNTSGITGVRWENAGNRWVAKIKVGGRNVHLGSFKSKADAARARKVAQIKFGFTARHGLPR